MAVSSHSSLVIRKKLPRSVTSIDQATQSLGALIVPIYESTQKAAERAKLYPSRAEKNARSANFVAGRTTPMKTLRWPQMDLASYRQTRPFDTPEKVKIARA
jgi:hypothetical protein